jgi:ABC-type bacteriocin/lantibiotic exporter with double-glycine peptidase domain
VTPDREPRARSLSTQLDGFLTLAEVTSRRWLGSVVLAAVALALLDTLGVAAMVPLMQLLTAGEADPVGPTRLAADLVGSPDPRTLVPVVAGFVAVVFVGKSVGTIAFRWWLLGRTTRVSADAAAALLRGYVLSPYETHRARSLSEVYRAIGDATAQSASVLLGVVGLVADLLMLGAIVVVLVVVSPGVTLLVSVMFGLLVGVVQRLMRRRQARLGEAIAEASLATWMLVIPALDGFREARLSSSAGRFADRYREAKRRQAGAQRELSVLSELPRYLLEIGFVVAICVISLVLFTVSSPQAALGTLAIFAAASLRALPTLNRVAATFAIVRANRVALDIVLTARDDLRAGPVHREESRSATPYAGDIELSDVAFRYADADEDVLRRVTTVIRQNSTVAFVGSSGAGKSTLIDIILGLLEPTRGQVRCGGRSIHDDLASWYSGLGVVPQEVFLSNDTLAANVAYGVAPDDRDAERIVEVLEMAQLAEVVSGLPDGLDTVVGERGVRLSGGQRQRIGLARALYRRPRLLVLDEATSALDNATEHEIGRTLHHLRGSLTIIVVAHRLSTVRDADRVVFLKSGTIAAEGAFGTVRSVDADFAHLVALGELT